MGTLVISFIAICLYLEHCLKLSIICCIQKDRKGHVQLCCIKKGLGFALWINLLIICLLILSFSILWRRRLRSFVWALEYLVLRNFIFVPC